MGLRGPVMNAHERAWGAVLHFGSACAATAGPAPPSSTAGILKDSAGPASTTMHASPAWAGICGDHTAAPSSPSDPPVSPDLDAEPSPPSPQRLRFAPLAFTTSAPDLALPTPTFGPSPFHTAPRAPPTVAAVTPGPSLQSFQTPCGTDPASAAHEPAPSFAPGSSPLTGANAAAGAPDFLTRPQTTVSTDESGPGHKISPCLQGGPSAPHEKAATAGSSRPGHFGLGNPETETVSAAAAAGTVEAPSAAARERRLTDADRPTGIRRSSGTVPRRSLPSQELARSRLPRAPARLSGACLPVTFACSMHALRPSAKPAGTCVRVRARHPWPRAAC